MTRITIVFFLFPIFILINSCKPGKPPKEVKVKDNSYIDIDVLPDVEYPAGLVELKFNSSGSKIYGFEYTANGAGPHPTVILLHGNPGNERNLDLGQNLRRNGYNVVYFDYRGSWGSEGAFTYANAIGDTRAIIDFITDTTKKNDLRVDYDNIFLVGHSFAAGTALLEGLHDDRIKGIVGLSLFNPHQLLQGKNAQLNANDIYTYLSSGLGMLKINPNKYLKEIIANIKDYDIEKEISQTQKPVLIIDEHSLNDYLINYRSHKNLSYEMWETDIAFTNKRIALSKKIKKWLDVAVHSNK